MEAAITDALRCFNPFSTDIAKIDLACYLVLMITPSQCRAARGLLKWSQQQLADAARIGIVTVRQFENEQAEPRSATLQVVETALRDAGVIFIESNGNGPGVRLRDRQG
jgi:hypothetical protein